MHVRKCVWKFYGGIGQRRGAAANSCWTIPEAGRDGFAIVHCVVVVAYSCKLLWPRWKVNWTNFHLSSHRFIHLRATSHPDVHRLNLVDTVIYAGMILISSSVRCLRRLDGSICLIRLIFVYWMRIVENGDRSWSLFNKQQHWFGQQLFHTVSAALDALWRGECRFCESMRLTTAPTKCRQRLEIGLVSTRFLCKLVFALALHLNH